MVPTRRISRSAVVPYSAEQMYALVDDIESYPLFVPHCAGSEILQRTDREVTAILVLLLHRVRYRLTSRNVMHPDHAIQIQLLDGPFSSLQAQWEFESQQPGSCRISFEIEFRFKNWLLAKLLDGVILELAGSLPDVFYRRAQQIYAADPGASL